jgi:hypothetical protein
MIADRTLFDRKMRHELAVVIPTVGRPHLLRAVRSLYSQRFAGRMQILIGVDADLTGRVEEMKIALETECPQHISLVWLNPGYSTSRRHGGIHECCFGGSMRAVLSLLADSRLVMYLDDDDWLLPDHVASVLRAVEGKLWAFALSWFCDGNTAEILCRDEIESVGVGRGIFASKLGGFVRPSGMIIDKLALLKYLHLWARSPFSKGDGVDRLIFDRLRRHPHGCTEEATVCYALDPGDDLHEVRRKFIEDKGRRCPEAPKAGSVRTTTAAHPASGLRHDAAVVVTTVCRRSLLRAVRSVYAQRFDGRIQVLVGVDVDRGGCEAELRSILGMERPDHMSLVWLNPGYSTSRRHGGPHTNHFGGSLRSAMTLLADSRVVIYLDDDDWLLEDHAAAILRSMEGKKWAFSYSWYCDGDTGERLCVDEIESVGAGRGMYQERFGGYVRPSGLAVDQIALLKYLHLWSSSPFDQGDGEDRVVFDRLRHEPHGCTGQATVCYALDPKDAAHETRLEFMKSKGVAFRSAIKAESVR